MTVRTVLTPHLGRIASKPGFEWGHAYELRVVQTWALALSFLLNHLVFVKDEKRLSGLAWCLAQAVL